MSSKYNYFKKILTRENLFIFRNENADKRKQERDKL